MKKNRKRAYVKQALFPFGGDSQDIFTPAQQAAPPFLNQGIPGIFGSQTSESAPSKSGSNIFSVLDRFGGIDGVISSVGKIQKLFGLFKQISPMFKLFGSLMGPKAAIKSVSNKKVKMKAGKAHKPRSALRSRRTSKGYDRR